MQRMHPRYRRLIIPALLTGLILTAVVAKFVN